MNFITARDGIDCTAAFWLKGVWREVVATVLAIGLAGWQCLFGLRCMGMGDDAPIFWERKTKIAELLTH